MQGLVSAVDTLSKPSATGKEFALTTPAERNAQEIAALFAVERHDLAEDQIVAITDFIQQIGSVERAKAASRR